MHDYILSVWWIFLTNKNSAKYSIFILLCLYFCIKGYIYKQTGPITFDALKCYHWNFHIFIPYLFFFHFSIFVLCKPFLKIGFKFKDYTLEYTRILLSSAIGATKSDIQIPQKFQSYTKDRLNVNARFLLWNGCRTVAIYSL